MESPLTTIPWDFVASFAQEMLSSVTQQGVGISLYEGYYSSPAACGLKVWRAYFATVSGENLVFVSLLLRPDPGHFISPRAAWHESRFKASEETLWLL